MRVDDIVTRLLAGETIEEVASDFDLPTETSRTSLWQP